MTEFRPGAPRDEASLDSAFRRFSRTDVTGELVPLESIYGRARRRTRHQRVGAVVATAALLFGGVTAYTAVSDAGRTVDGQVATQPGEPEPAPTATASERAPSVRVVVPPVEPRESAAPQEEPSTGTRPSGSPSPLEPSADPTASKAAPDGRYCLTDVVLGPDDVSLSGRGWVYGSADSRPGSLDYQPLDGDVVGWPISPDALITLSEAIDIPGRDLHEPGGSSASLDAALEEVTPHLGKLTSKVKVIDGRVIYLDVSADLPEFSDEHGCGPWPVDNRAGD